MRQYEIIFIINPDLSEEDTKGIIDKVKEIIQTLRGEVLKIDEWGQKKLAYDVKNHSKGYFVLLHFMGTPQILTEIERNLKIMDSVLKHQTVRLDEKAEKTAQMLSGERISEKGEKPETTPGERPENSAKGVDVTEGRAADSSPEGEKPPEESKRSGEKGTDT
ncbi:MAG: 30S ribosomal protein S6 [Proteobacteria bacterium]|nr:30S ribosomal protein S6 [Pseudomonadota bacterium]NIS70342.1 30S ribosomal protein S6 [Pseudomonadota bacterium]